MSPHTQHPAPSPSRPAVAVYLLSGVVGLAGLFAAVRDVTADDDTVDVFVVDTETHPVDVAFDPRLAIGVWREGADTVILDANGAGSHCIGGFRSAFAWHMAGRDVVDGGGAVIGSYDSTGQTLTVGARSFLAAVGGGL